MTPEERALEFDVTVQTRLGELCGRGEPTPEQLRMAKAEAQAHCDAIDEVEGSGE